MKNKFALIALLGLFLAGTYTVYAQDSNDTVATEQVVDTAVVAEEAPAEVVETVEEAPAEEASFHQIIKQKFIEG